MSRYVYASSEGQPFIRYNTEKGGFVGAAYPFPNSASNADTLLMLRNALVLEESNDASFAEKGLTFEVEQQLGDGVVRCIALGSSDGLRRGM